MQITFPPGIKWTKQRKRVYEVLHQVKEPLSALQIYRVIMKESENKEEADREEHVFGNSANYAMSTIYRILAVFEEHHLLVKTGKPDSNMFVYELNRGQHTHYAVCLSCHKHILLHNCPFEHMDLPKAEGDFTITGHKLELYGYCSVCQNQSEK